MNSEIFDIFETWAKNYKVACHFEMMEDFPTLTDFSQFQNIYTQATNFFREGNISYEQSSSIALFFPPLKYESQADYFRRLANTSPFNVYKTIIYSVIGLMGRKNFTIENQDTAETEFIFNIDGAGNSLQSFINNYCFSAIMSGIGGIFVDWIKNKPVWSIYDARTISRKHLIKDFVDGREYLKRVVLVTEEKEETEPFEYETRKKALCLKIINKMDLPEFLKGDFVKVSDEKDSSNFVAVFEVYKESKDGVEKVDFGAFKSKDGSYMDSLPFFIFGAGENCELPFYSAIRKNLKHADLESVFEEALKISNFPMMYGKFNGDQVPSDIENDGYQQKQVMKISSKSFFELGVDEEIGFIEWKGTSFDKTIQYLDILVRQVSQMIINKLSDQQSQKTKAQYEGEQMTDTSLLLYMIDSIEKAINSANVTTAKYLNIDPEKAPLISLNKDLVKEVTSPNFLNSIIQAWESKLISGDTSIKSLQQKEIIPIVTNFQMEQEKILEEETFAGTE